MAKNKTVETSSSVRDFVKAIKNEKRRSDVSEIIDLVSDQTGFEPKMWGTAIVGFGRYDYKYESGHEGSAPFAGLASRANAIVLYLSGNFEGREELLAQFGKHKTSKGCVYIKKLEDVDKKVLVKMFKKSIQHTRKLYPA